MELPSDIILIRHAESEINVANRRARSGEDLFTPEFRARSKSSWRLTDVGREQSRITGEWLREEGIASCVDGFYVSEYVRALETASLLNLPYASWRRDANLSERDWGLLEVMSDDERRSRFRHEILERQREPMYWIPPKGESIAMVCRRIDFFLDRLRREVSGGRVIVVTHGEVMWAFRIVIERLTSIQFKELAFSLDPHDRIHNTQVIQYSRCVENSVLQEPHFWRMRSSLPSGPSLAYGEWKAFNPTPLSSNKSLLRDVEKITRMIK